MVLHTYNVLAELLSLRQEEGQSCSYNQVVLQNLPSKRALRKFDFSNAFNSVKMLKGYIPTGLASLYTPLPSKHVEPLKGFPAGRYAFDHNLERQSQLRSPPEDFSGYEKGMQWLAWVMPDLTDISFNLFLVVAVIATSNFS